MQFVGVTIVLGTWYTVGVISLYVLLLFRLLRKRGLGDPRLKALFGFVYLRFEERFYWWELLETGRKMMLVIIKVFVDNSLLKVVVTAPVVLFGLITNLLYNPFKVMCHPS